MTLQELITHYGNLNRVSKAVGISIANVHRWKRQNEIPWITQLVIEKRTNGLFIADAEDEFNSKYSKH
jgi:hypothetical protein